MSEQKLAPPTRAGTNPTASEQKPESRRQRERAAGPKGHEPGVLMVRPGRVLVWPDLTLRGTSGYCLAVDDPFIGTPGAENDCRGVLMPAPPGSKPHDPYDQKNPYPRHYLVKLEALQGRPQKVEPTRLDVADVDPDALPDAED